MLFTPTVPRTYDLSRYKNTDLRNAECEHGNVF